MCFSNNCQSLIHRLQQGVDGVNGRACVNGAQGKCAPLALTEWGEYDVDMSMREGYYWPGNTKRRSYNGIVLHFLALFGQLTDID